MNICEDTMSFLQQFMIVLGPWEQAFLFIHFSQMEIAKWKKGVPETITLGEISNYLCLSPSSWCCLGPPQKCHCGFSQVLTVSMNRSKWLYMPVMGWTFDFVNNHLIWFFVFEIQNQRNTSSRLWGENQIYKLPDLVISKSSNNLCFSWSLEVILDCGNVKPPSVQLICMWWLFPRGLWNSGNLHQWMIMSTGRQRSLYLFITCFV
jgi:hypothetical protein